MADMYWENVKKTFEEQTAKGVKLLKHYVIDFDKLEKSSLYNKDLPFILTEELKDELGRITSIVYDETDDLLFVLTDENQYKFSEVDNVMMLNDFPVSEKKVYVPGGKTLIKK